MRRTELKTKLERVRRDSGHTGMVLRVNYADGPLRANTVVVALDHPTEAKRYGRQPAAEVDDLLLKRAQHQLEGILLDRAVKSGTIFDALARMRESFQAVRSTVRKMINPLSMGIQQRFRVYL